MKKNPDHGKNKFDYDQKLRQNIQEKYRDGHTVRVPTNCFLGNTSYNDKYDQFENVVKSYPIVPARGAIGGHKFRGVSAYGHQMNSEMHK